VQTRPALQQRLKHGAAAQPRQLRSAGKPAVNPAGTLNHYLVAIRIIYNAVMPRIVVVVAIVLTIVIALAIRFLARSGVTAVVLVNDAS
jgi:hypothetical protein